MKTRVTELLGIEYPIIQGGMAWVAEQHLAAAVSNAGGLGLIGGANAPGEVVRDMIRKCRELTDKPFGVNVMLMSPYAPDVAKVVVEEGVKIVTTGAGDPAKYMNEWKAAGIKVIPVVASVAHAKLMQKAGADAIVAEGTESGGHIGEATTMTLVPQVVDAVDIPVIAAGGICLPVLERVCNGKHMGRQPMPVRCIAGALSITSVEFCFGIIFNCILQQNVWDYSQMPLNLMGQICLPYTLLWVLLSFPAIQLCRLLGKYFS